MSGVSQRAGALTAIGFVLVTLAVTAAVWMATADGTEQPVEPMGPAVRATLEHDGLDEFSQVNRLNGDLTVTSARARSGRRAARATYRGRGANGYARAIYNVSWPQGSEVGYSAAFYIPAATLDAVQGQVSLMRWDDFSSRPRNPRYGGIVIYRSDKRLHLINAELGGERPTQNDLIDSIEVPVNRWFTVGVRQRLGGEAPRNEVYLDGRLVGESERPNLPTGRTVRRVRYGLVSTAGPDQVRPLELWFDDATAMPGPARER